PADRGAAVLGVAVDLADEGRLRAAAVRRPAAEHLGAGRARRYAYAPPVDPAARPGRAVVDDEPDADRAVAARRVRVLREVRRRGSNGDRRRGARAYEPHPHRHGHRLTG